MNQVKSIRERRGLSRAELARRTALGPTVISQTETGRFIPYPKQLRRIAEALGVKPEELGIVQPDQLQSAS